MTIRGLIDRGAETPLILRMVLTTLREVRKDDRIVAGTVRLQIEAPRTCPISGLGNPGEYGFASHHIDGARLRAHSWWERSPRRVHALGVHTCVRSALTESSGKRQCRAPRPCCRLNLGLLDRTPDCNAAMVFVLSSVSPTEAPRRRLGEPTATACKKTETSGPPSNRVLCDRRVIGVDADQSDSRRVPAWRNALVRAPVRRRSAFAVQAILRLNGSCNRRRRTSARPQRQRKRNLRRAIFLSFARAPRLLFR